jgi:hypothetical protein
MSRLILKGAFAPLVRPMEGRGLRRARRGQGHRPHPRRGLARFDPPELRWFWSITEIVPAVPNVTKGHAATPEAKAKFREAWKTLAFSP